VLEGLKRQGAEVKWEALEWSVEASLPGFGDTGTDAGGVCIFRSPFRVSNL